VKSEKKERRSFHEEGSSSDLAKKEVEREVEDLHGVVGYTLLARLR